MVRYIRFLLFVCVVVGFGRFSAPVVSQDPASSIIQLVNQVRAGYGLAAYQYNATLAVAAQNHANWMASTGTYSHTQTNGSTPQSRANAAGYSGYVSENIVGGTSLTPSQGVTWWTNSAVHFNTMISNRYTEIGVGFATGQDQNFYVMVVGNPSDSPPVVASNNVTNNQPDAVAMVAPIVLAASREDGSIVHVVGPGQSVWAIAARYEVPLTDIFLFNNLNESSVVQPGQELLIRLAEGAAPPPTPTPPATYMVHEGDTLWTIAIWNKVELADLLWLNQLPEDAVLQPGQEVVLRLLPGQAPPPTATPQLAHIVQSGETLWTVAAVHGLTLDQLLAFNQMAADVILHVGDALWVVPPQTPTAVPPTPLPETPTFTPQPATETAVPASTSPPRLAAVPNSAPTATQMIPTTAPAQPENSGMGTAVFTIIAWVVAGLLLVGVAAILFIRYDS